MRQILLIIYRATQLQADTTQSGIHAGQIGSPCSIGTWTYAYGSWDCNVPIIALWECHSYSERQWTRDVGSKETNCMQRVHNYVATCSTKREYVSDVSLEFTQTKK